LPTPRSTRRFTGIDAAGLGLVILFALGMYAFRHYAIEPRATVGLCAAANAPAFCGPRAAVLSLQYYQGFGWAALLLGLAAFFAGWRWAAIFAIAIGAAAVINYNATTGIIGAALGLITWLSLATGRYQASP
jgi:hypothetical protein